MAEDRKPPQSRMGRPTKLTPELMQKICNTIKAGNYVYPACLVHGINPKTHYDWLKQGNTPGAPKKYRDYCNAIEEAQAYSQVRLVSIVSKASETDAKFAVTMLERMFPKQWGRKEQIKLFEAENGESFGAESSHSALVDLIEEKNNGTDEEGTA